MRALISIRVLLACVLPAASQTVDAIVVQSVTEVDCRGMRNTRYPATHYAILRNIMTALKKAYDQRIVLRRK